MPSNYLEELVVPWVVVAPLVMGLNPGKAQYELTAKLAAANHSLVISADRTERAGNKRDVLSELVVISLTYYSY